MSSNAMKFVTQKAVSNLMQIISTHRNVLLIYSLKVGPYINLNFMEHFASQQNAHDSVSSNLISMQ